MILKVADERSLLKNEKETCGYSYTKLVYDYYEQQQPQ